MPDVMVMKKKFHIEQFNRLSCNVRDDYNNDMSIRGKGEKNDSEFYTKEENKMGKGH